MLNTNPIPVTLEDIQQAAERIQTVVKHTPLLEANRLSEALGYRVSLKLENLQRTGAFKLRGAYNKIATLTPQQKQFGLVAASSGNHAQGVAYAARAFGLDSKTRIFVPNTTPHTKIENTRRHGQVEIVMVEGVFDDAKQEAQAEANRTGATFIEPYNDWDIIAGQGTIGLEILHDAPDTDVIIAPVGGGGLLSGIALAAHSLKPDLKLYGIGAAYAYGSGTTIADGIRVKQVGDKPSLIFEQHIEQIIKVAEDKIEKAVQLLLHETHLVVEGAGAAGLAALQTGVLTFAPETHIVIVLSGGNIDLRQWNNLVE